MGNAAGKEFKEVELGKGTLHTDDSLSIAPSLVSATATKTIHSKLNKWVDQDSGEMLWKFKKIGIIHYHTLVRDADKNVLARIVTLKLGMASSTNVVLKSTPSYEGQEAVAAENLKKAGIEDGLTLYPFAKIVCKLGLTSGICTYSIITGAGEDDEQVVYTGEKLSAIGFMAIFKDASGTAVAKAATHPMSFNPVLESAIGVDLLAIVCIGNVLASGGNSVGGLAGAGVV